MVNKKKWYYISKNCTNGLPRFISTKAHLKNNNKKKNKGKISEYKVDAFEKKIYFITTIFYRHLIE